MFLVFSYILHATDYTGSVIQKNKLILTPQTLSQTLQIAGSPLSQRYLDYIGFGSNGTGTTYLPFSISNVLPVNDQAQAVALQPDGKIVVAGTSPGGFSVVRFLSSGELDTTFGTSGVNYIPFTIIPGGTGDAAKSVAIQSDGKIVIGGYSYAADFSTRFSLARFLSNGQLDTSFGQVGTAQAGTQYIPFFINNGSLLDSGRAVALQSDGRIVLAGDSNNKFAVACFLSNG